MSLLKKIWLDARLMWNSLFYGMKAADTVINAQTGTEDDAEIHKQVRKGGVFNDLIEQKVTKEVEEIRDKNYRILREADKYTAGDLVMTEEEIINENGEKEVVVNFKGGMKKKTKEDFLRHPPVFEKEGFYLRLIQDNKFIQKY